MPTAMVVRKLTRSEQSQISSLIRRNSSARVLRRSLMIRLSGQGKTTGEISSLLGYPRATVHHVIKRFNARGTPGLHDDFRCGRPPSLTTSQLVTLEHMLSLGPQSHGWFNDLWTSRRVQKLITIRFGVRLAAGTVCKILNKSLGWTLQRPRHQDRKRDEVRIQNWKTIELKRIIKEARRRKAYLAFSDETGFMLMPTLRRTYAPRGCQPVHKVTDPHGRISTIGVITISPERRHLNFFYHLLADNKNFHGDSIAQFLAWLCTQIRAPMTLIWDSYRIHTAHEVQDYVTENRDIILEPFPPNAPEINPVDAVWSYVKHGRLPNYTPFSLDELRKRVTKELCRLKKRPDLLAACVRRTRLTIPM